MLHRLDWLARTQASHNSTSQVVPVILSWWSCHRLRLLGILTNKSSLFNQKYRKRRISQAAIASWILKICTKIQKSTSRANNSTFYNLETIIFSKHFTILSFLRKLILSFIPSSRLHLLLIMPKTLIFLIKSKLFN